MMPGRETEAALGKPAMFSGLYVWEVVAPQCVKMLRSTSEIQSWVDFTIVCVVFVDIFLSREIDLIIASLIRHDV